VVGSRHLTATNPLGVAQWVVNGVPWVMLIGLPIVGVAALLLV